MDSGFAVHLMAQLFWTGLLICMPVLGVIMLIGVLISLLQVVTQVQEMSLSFVPKLFIVAITLVICGPWMLRKLTQYATGLWSGIPSML